CVAASFELQRRDVRATSVSATTEHARSRPAPPAKDGPYSQVVPREARLPGPGAREASPGRAPGGTPFSVPAGPVVPLLATAVILWMLSNATRREFTIEALVLVGAALLYFIRKRSGQ